MVLPQNCVLWPKFEKLASSVFGLKYYVLSVIGPPPVNPLQDCIGRIGSHRVQPQLCMGHLVKSSRHTWNVWYCHTRALLPIMGSNQWCWISVKGGGT